MLNKPHSSNSNQAFVSNNIERQARGDVEKHDNRVKALYRNNHKRLSEMTIFKRILKLTESCLSQRLAGLSLVLIFLLGLPLITNLSIPAFITTPVLMMGVCVLMFLSGLISLSIRSWFHPQMKSKVKSIESVPVGSVGFVLNAKNGMLGLLLISFSHAYAAPGGVGTNLSVWLKADAGVTDSGSGTTNLWADQSGNSNNASQSVSGEEPAIVLNGINFNPTLDFTSDQLEMGVYDAGNNYDFIMVAEPNTTAPHGMFDSAPSQGNVFRNNSGAMELWNGDPSIALSTSANHPTIFAFDVDVNPNRSMNYYRNSLAITTSATGGTASIAWTSPDIGSVNDANSYNGSIAEVVIYNANLASVTERNQIYSYLALKYGITLNQTTAADYFASDCTDATCSTGTKIWDSSVNTTYNNDIFGIGRDSSSELDQRISKSVNAGAILTVEHGG